MPQLSAEIQQKEDVRGVEVPGRHPHFGPGLRLRCLNCESSMQTFPYGALANELDPIVCKTCSWEIAQSQGIWMALLPGRKDYFRQFMKEYGLVREREGRDSSNSQFYRALPHRDVTGRHSWQWSIRSKTYRYIQQSILPLLSHGPNSPLSILDLGAGNGWLSYRLARLGHRPVAVDLLMNQGDGLAAASHYRVVLPYLFPRFQAELDRLPFAGNQFDCSIFNASFHYSENYEQTLAEAIRCVRPGGMIIIADTPWYSQEEYGQLMLKERRGEFQRQFGFASDSLSSCEYLTDERLAALEVQHEIEWEIHRPWYGFRWALRPHLAKWRRRREPAEFRIYMARVKAP